jgi:hypothetical protein
MSEFEESLRDEPSILSGRINVFVIDYWTGQPLQGVPVCFAVSMMQKSCSRLGGVTDQNGFLTLESPIGPAYLFIAPDFTREVWVSAERAVEATFECPDFVKVIRHGFDT